MRSMIRIKRTFNLILTLALWFTMAQTTMAAITGSGTADDPYLISSTEDWNTKDDTYLVPVTIYGDWLG